MRQRHDQCTHTDKMAQGIIISRLLTASARTNNDQFSDWPKLVPVRNQPNHNWGTIHTSAPTQHTIEEKE